MTFPLSDKVQFSKFRVGPDPKREKCRNAKAMRKERKLQKLAAKASRVSRKFFLVSFARDSVLDIVHSLKFEAVSASP